MRGTGFLLRRLGPVGLDGDPDQAGNPDASQTVCATAGLGSTITPRDQFRSPLTISENAIAMS